MRSTNRAASLALPFQGSDLRGLCRLGVDATVGVTDLVEAMHHTIGSRAGIAGAAPTGKTSGITGLVYRSVRATTRLVGKGGDAVLGALTQPAGTSASRPEREAMIAALNGIWGDHLVASENPLAIAMSLRAAGRPLDLSGGGIGAQLGAPGRKLLVLVHGLCMSDLQWTRRGHDHGLALARDLGFTPVYIHYNSGLHVSVNGRAFAALLDTLVAQWPVPVTELAIVAHSMGGLVARSACRIADDDGHAWRRQLSTLVFLGTPHEGAPMERGGNWIDTILGVSPYTAPFARLGKVRSAGITDLRHGSLCDEDWQQRDRFARSRHRPQHVPLPAGVRCLAIGATTGKAVGDAADRLLSDGLVPLPSALGRHADPARALAFPEAGQWIGHEMNHLDLLDRPEVYRVLRQWLAA